MFCNSLYCLTKNITTMRRVCGLDVHKDNIFVCILGENGEKIEFKSGILTVELDSFRDRLVNLGVGEVAMESTSVYWMPVWRILSGDFRLYLVNPLAIKQLPGRKSDVKDAEWIATCLLKDLIRGSFVPEERVQQLRQYSRRLFDLNKQSVYVQNKMDAALQRCNIRLSNYVSNVDTKTYREVLSLLCEGETNPEVLIGKVHTRIINRHGRDTVLASLTGVVSQADTDMFRQLSDELGLLRQHRGQCQTAMLEICQREFPKEFALISEVPGINAQSATQILAEIGGDMNMFPSASTLVSWAGLKPRNDNSNGKIKSRKVTHGNKYLKKILVECSWAASRTQGCFFNRFSYRMVNQRKKSRLKVQVAIARKLLVVIWNILSKGIAYTDYMKVQEISENDHNNPEGGR